MIIASSIPCRLLFHARFFFLMLFKMDTTFPLKDVPRLTKKWNQERRLKLLKSS